jgi:hypothetical protein
MEMLSRNVVKSLIFLSQALVHVARKMPKNAHAHFMLGLMYQRLGQPQKVNGHSL